MKNESLIPSPKVATTIWPGLEVLLLELQKQFTVWRRCIDFVCLNFANPDMVESHRIIWRSCWSCWETADGYYNCNWIKGIENGYSFIIHNTFWWLWCMVWAILVGTARPTTNLAPCVLIDKDFKTVADGKLGATLFYKFRYPKTRNYDWAGLVY